MKHLFEFMRPLEMPEPTPVQIKSVAHTVCQSGGTHVHVTAHSASKEGAEAAVKAVARELVHPARMFNSEQRYLSLKPKRLTKEEKQ